MGGKLTYKDVLLVMDEAIKCCPNALLRREVLTAAATGLALERPDDPVAYVCAILNQPMAATRLPMHRPRSAPTVRRPVECERHPPPARPPSTSPRKGAHWTAEEMDQAEACNRIAVTQRRRANRTLSRNRVERQLWAARTEEEAAITRIQAQQRGRIARKGAGQRKAAHNAEVSSLPPWIVPVMEIDPDQLTKRGGYLGLKTGFLMLTPAGEQANAARDIQAIARGRAARQHVARLRE